MVCRVFPTDTIRPALEPVAPDSVRAGKPSAGVHELPITGLACGVWEHTIGVSTDIEVDEVFVVLQGRARVDVEGQESLQIGPGDVVVLEAGARTTWHVFEDLRKFWVLPGSE